MRATFGLAIAVLALSGAEVRPVSHQIRVDSNLAVPMRDGAKLYADVYRPIGPGKFPVLVVRTPYGKQREGIHETQIKFAQRGYAVLVQDVRGRFESEGKWDPFRYEAEDGYDTVEWAARQPWSNGKVGMEGGSYLGNVQWQAAAQTPPSLIAIFPVVASTSLYHNTWFHGGAFKLALAFGWGVVRNPRRVMYPQHWHTEPYVPDEWRYENLFWRLPLKSIDVASSQPVPHFRDWIAHQSYDDYWKSISVEEKFDRVKVPVHVHGGWYDLLLGGTLNGFTGMRKQGGSPVARQESKIVVGPWGHGPTQKFGDVDFGPHAMRILFERNLWWFDHYLKGEDNGIDREPPVEIFYMGVNRWVHHDDWPVPGTRFTPFYLSSGGRANSARGDGVLSVEKPGGTPPSDHFTYDPDNPVPTHGGNDCCGAPIPAGPVDQRRIEARNDVLVYTSAILKEPLAIAGPVKMKLYAATDVPDTDFFIKLVDVHPYGFAMNIAEGILRTRFRKSLDRMELLKPGQSYEFEIDMRGTANVFRRGHRIRVDVTSSNFPQFDRNPNTGEDLGASDRVRVARQTILHSARYPSHILLPVVEVP